METNEQVIYAGEEYDFYGRASVADCETLDSLWKEIEWKQP